MPFIPNTPESLIARSDSKNAATTCRGITSGGRPCRRPLTATPTSSLPAPPPAGKGRANRRRVDDPSDPDLYCWQHKDQAISSAKPAHGFARTKLSPIRQGSRESLRSLESLVGRLGIIDNERIGRKPPRNSHGLFNGRLNEKNSGTASVNVTESPGPNQKPKVEKRVSFCCCFTVPVYETDRPETPKPRPLETMPQKPSSAKLPPQQQHLGQSSATQRPNLATSKESSAQSMVPQTSQYLALIPTSVLPETAATLMKELSKPFSPTDEAGYIYIFWLTPGSQTSPPPVQVTRDLLAPPRPDMHQRRTSDVLQSYATQGQTGTANKTLLLKIGRASNVQRRLNEWQRQCGYDISLIRYYPYVSSSQQSAPRKMPHSHKVERLIHIELEGQGLRVNSKVNCPACGKIHKEWFEVEATRAGINAVDEIVRRWSDWDEGNQ